MHVHITVTRGSPLLNSFDRRQKMIWTHFAQGKGRNTDSAALNERGHLLHEQGRAVPQGHTVMHDHTGAALQLLQPQALRVVITEETLGHSGHKHTTSFNTPSVILLCFALFFFLDLFILDFVYPFFYIVGSFWAHRPHIHYMFPHEAMQTAYNQIHLAKQPDSTTGR